MYDTYMSPSGNTAKLGATHSNIQTAQRAPSLVGSEPTMHWSAHYWVSSLYSLCQPGMIDIQSIYLSIYLSIYILIKLWSSCLLDWLRPCVDSIIQGFSRSVMKIGWIIVPPVTQVLRSKWLNFFSRCTERKIESFWPKKLGQIFVPPVTQLFRSKWLNFFYRCTERNIESLLGQIFVPSVTQLFWSNWLIFFFRCTERKIESFWLRKLGQIFVPPVTQLFRSNFSSANLVPDFSQL